MKLRNTITTLCLFVALLIPSIVFAAEKASALHVAFETEVTTAINKILADSVIKNWSMSLSIFLTAVCLFIALAKWAKDGSLLDVFVTCILFIIFLGLYPVYGVVVDTVFGACVELGDSMYKAAIGNTTEDVILESFINAVSLPTAGFFDAFDVFIMSILWYIAIAFLSLAVYFADIWLVVGLAIAKVIGVLFLPFLIAPVTQRYFSSWVNFFIFWGVSAIFLRLTSIITMLIMKASLNAVAAKKNVGDIIGNDFTANKVVEMGTDNMLLLISLAAFVFIAALMIFGSFKLAQQCLGAGSSAGASLNNGATALAKKAMLLF